MQSIVSQSEYEVDSATYEADVAGKDAFVTQFLDFMFCKDKVQSRPRYVIVRRVHRQAGRFESVYEADEGPVFGPKSLPRSPHY